MLCSSLLLADGATAVNVNASVLLGDTPSSCELHHGTPVLRTG